MLNEQLLKKGNILTCPVAVIISGGKVLIGHRHYTPDKWKTISVWTCPGGRCSEGETIERALRREVKEEVGINDLKITEYLGKVPGAKKGDKVLLFLCRTSQEPRNLESRKFSEWKWEKPEDIEEETFINPSALKLIRRATETS